jgi:hypothetical protein
VNSADKEFSGFEWSLLAALTVVYIVVMFTLGGC